MHFIAIKIIQRFKRFNRTHNDWIEPLLSPSFEWGLYRPSNEASIYFHWMNARCGRNDMPWYMFYAFCRSSSRAAVHSAPNGVERQWKRGELLKSRKNCSHLIKLSKQMKYTISVRISDFYLWPLVLLNAEQIFILNQIARSCRYSNLIFSLAQNWKYSVFYVNFCFPFNCCADSFQ